MPYIPPEVIEQARQIDLLSYMQAFEPGELVRITVNNYTTRTHDSLKISNGKWMWWSQRIGGYNALDYLVKVKGCSFVQAVETLMEKARLRVRNPQQIANLPKEAASTTPALRQTPNRFAEGKESKFYESLQNQSLFDDEATQNFADTTDLKYYQGITNEKVFSGIFATAYRPNESRGNRRNCWRDFG